MKDTRKDRMRRRRELDRRKRSKSPYDGPPNDPVIGYVCRQGIQMVCDDDACIVAGTREAMVAILQYHRRNPAEHTIEPARCSHILQAMALGGAYALDEQAYGRFLPEAQRAGLPLVEEDFSDPGPTGIHLVRIGFL
jgi:hypothetical protein